MNTPIQWSEEDVESWLLEKGFSQDITSTFRENGVDGRLLLELTNEELENDLKIENVEILRKLRENILGLMAQGGPDKLNSRKRKNMSFPTPKKKRLNEVVEPVKIEKAGKRRTHDKSEEDDLSDSELHQRSPAPEEKPEQLPNLDAFELVQYYASIHPNIKYDNIEENVWELSNTDFKCEGHPVKMKVSEGGLFQIRVFGHREIAYGCDTLKQALIYFHGLSATHLVCPGIPAADILSLNVDVGRYTSLVRTPGGNFRANESRQDFRCKQFYPRPGGGTRGWKSSNRYDIIPEGRAIMCSSCYAKRNRVISRVQRLRNRRS